MDLFTLAVVDLNPASIRSFFMLSYPHTCQGSTRGGSCWQLCGKIVQQIKQVMVASRSGPCANPIRSLLTDLLPAKPSPLTYPPYWLPYQMLEKVR